MLLSRNCLFCVQATLLSTVPTATAFHRYVPFFGLAAHLLQSPTAQPAQQEQDSAAKASSE